jgi:hypothetical protein
MNITGMLYLHRKFEANLKGSPSLFTHAKCAQSVNDDINTRNLTSRHWHACLEVKFGFKKKILGNLSEGSVPVIFISMVPAQSWWELTKVACVDASESCNSHSCCTGAWLYVLCQPRVLYCTVLYRTVLYCCTCIEIYIFGLYMYFCLFNRMFMHIVSYPVSLALQSFTQMI